jgi:hypothetical protein
MSNIRGGALPGFASPINGIFPQYLFFVQSTAANLGGASAITAYLPAIRGHVRFVTFTSGAETIKIQGSRDRSTWSDLTPIDETTGNPASSVQLTTGGPKYWRLPIKEAGRWRHFQFVKSAGTNQGIVALACPVQELVGPDIYT